MDPLGALLDPRGAIRVIICLLPVIICLRPLQDGPNFAKSTLGSLLRASEELLELFGTHLGTLGVILESCRDLLDPF